MKIIRIFPRATGKRQPRAGGKRSIALVADSFRGLRWSWLCWICAVGLKPETRATQSHARRRKPIRGCPRRLCAVHSIHKLWETFGLVCLCANCRLVGVFCGSGGGGDWLTVIFSHFFGRCASHVGFWHVVFLEID